MSSFRQRQSHRLRAIWNTAFAVAIVACLAAVIGLGLIYFDYFLPLRQSMAEQVVGSVLDRNVKVRGSVDVTIGPRLKVHLEDAVVAQTSGRDGNLFENVTFNAGYGLLLGRFDDLSDLEMSGTNLVFESAATNSRSHGNTGYLTLPSHFINNPVLDNFLLSDVKLSFINAQNGWNEGLIINSFRSSTNANAKTAIIDLNASFNGTAFRVTGEVPASRGAREASNQQFDLVLALPGLASRLSGTIQTSSPIASVHARFSANSHSIIDLLLSFGLQSKLEGNASLEGTISGPLNELDVTGLHGILKSERGDEVRVGGSVLQVSGVSDADLGFNVALAQDSNEPVDRLSLEVQGLEGALRGSLSALKIESAVVRTNVALLDLNEIGPISVGRVVKSLENSVALEEILIRQGPKSSPYLTLTGRIADLIAFSGIDLAGSYRIPTSLLFGYGAQDLPELGQIEGTMRLNEASGALGIEELTGYSRDTALIDLDYDLAVPDFRVVDDVALSSTISLPEPADLLRALGQISGELPAMSFVGTSTLTQSGAHLNGLLTSGKTVVDADVGLAPVNSAKSLRLSGSVASERVNLPDLKGVVEFTRSVPLKIDNPVTLTIDTRSLITANVDVSVKEIVSGSKSAGNLTGNVTYQSQHLDFSSIEAQYLGGKIQGDFDLDLSSSPMTASAHGRVEKFPLASLLTEFGLKSPISSTVYASFEVSGNAGLETGTLSSLSGSVTTSLWGGILPNRALELSGMNALTWLATSNEDGTAKLVCAVFPLHFENGLASTHSIIVETENVQIAGTGSIDFRSGALDLSFVPRAKRKQLIEIVSPFEVAGTLGSPELTVKNAGARRAVGEVAVLPFNLLGQIFAGSGPIDEKARPCVLPKNAGPK
ncbi:AsmA family protein [Roseibium aggregatum]|uniref:AsmA family protein n=1 Tax=Roseibium aggregatum TaxID=187304 RepID=UPI0025AB63FD|nr:AsmA-like C-terminal region-containing protein [Roseibium aggregatum]WJS05818.1 AsmA-like C-terminal region-containing protein [Roseibium aggregatum]